MQRVIPTLRMTNYARSRQFYVEQLGFTINWEHTFAPGMPVFMEVERDGMQFYLTEHTGDCQPGGLVHLLLNTAAEVDAWYAEWRGRGVRIQEPPNNDLGMRMMAVVDPDGNQLRVFTRLE